MGYRPATTNIYIYIYIQTCRLGKGAHSNLDGYIVTEKMQLLSSTLWGTILSRVICVHGLL